MTAPRQAVTRLVERRSPGAAISRLAGDASSRIFYRVRPVAGPSVVVMDYGEPFKGETDDMRLNCIFRRAGLPVAEILEASPETGCLVLEDLGDRNLESELARRTSRDGEPLPGALGAAVDLAADVATRGTPVLAGSDRAARPALDAERFRYEMDFFLEHYVRGLLRYASVSDALRSQLHELADLAAQSPRRVLCHRDLHSRNLMVRSDGTLAMIDIQDARWGPDTYDLASLLRDAYVHVDEAWIDPAVDRYLVRVTPRPERGPFRERLHVVSIQRMIKALGSFGYLTGHLQTKRYLPAIPPTLERLAARLPRVPGLATLHEALTRAGLLTR